MKGNVVLVDDHVLLRDGLAKAVETMGYTVLFQADNGKDFQDKMHGSPSPDIVMMDINMPILDGYDTTLWLRQYYPEVKILALSMYDDEAAIIRMLKNGARGYILKDSHPSELKTALSDLMIKGFYQSELVTGTLMHTVSKMDQPVKSGVKELLRLTEREIEFLKLACSELTYKEIAEKMSVSPRTVDGYRDELFEKLEIKSRVGLVIFAIKQGIVRV